MNCTFSLGSASQNVAAAGGSGTISVTAPGGCSWTAASGAGWVTVAPPNGSGAGTVSFTVAANATTTARTATLTIGGQTFTVTPGRGELCVQPGERVTERGGGRRAVAWSRDGAGRLHLDGGERGGLGDGDASERQRRGDGHLHGGRECDDDVGADGDADHRWAGLHGDAGRGELSRCSLSGTVVRVGPAAASTSLDVTTPAGCGWAAASKVSWVTVTPGNGKGAAKVSVAVAANDTPSARTGSLTIAGTTVTVNQDVKPRPAAPKGIKVLPGKKK